MNSVSIVAENEAEAQEILAAYVAANIEPGSHVEGDPETELVQVQTAGGLDFELIEPDDAYFDTDDPTYIQDGDEKDGDESDTRKRKRKSDPGGPNRKKRSPVRYERVPQHKKPPFFCENCGRVFMKLVSFCHLKLSYFILLILYIVLCFPIFNRNSRLRYMVLCI